MACNSKPSDDLDRPRPNQIDQRTQLKLYEKQYKTALQLTSSTVTLKRHPRQKPLKRLTPPYSNPTIRMREHEDTPLVAQSSDNIQLGIIKFHQLIKTVPSEIKPLLLKIKEFLKTYKPITLINVFKLLFSDSKLDTIQALLIIFENFSIDMEMITNYSSKYFNVFKDFILAILIKMPSIVTVLNWISNMITGVPITHYISKSLFINVINKFNFSSNFLDLFYPDIEAYTKDCFEMDPLKSQSQDEDDPDNWTDVDSMSDIEEPAAKQVPFKVPDPLPPLTPRVDLLEPLSDGAEEIVEDKDEGTDFSDLLQPMTSKTQIKKFASVFLNFTGVRDFFTHFTTDDLLGISKFTMFTILGVYTIISLFQDGTKGFMKTVGRFTTLVKSAEYVVGGFGDFFEKMFVSTFAIFGVDVMSTKTRHFVEVADKLQSVSKKVRILKEMMESKLPEYQESGVSVDIYDKAMSELELIIYSKPDVAIPPTLLSQFNHVRKEVESLRQYEDSIFRGSAVRLEPTVLTLAGPTAIGKSKAVESIHLALQKLHKRKLTMCSKNPGDKYFSGYAGQEIVLLDDWGQRKDNTDHADLFTMVSTAKTTVNMAAVSDKGRPFISKYIILTTNNLELKNSKQVDNLQALARRRGIMYRMDLRAGRSMPVTSFSQVQMIRADETSITYRPQEGAHTEAFDVDKLASVMFESFHQKYASYKKSYEDAELIAQSDEHKFNTTIKSIHLTGAAGTGKTHLAHEYAKKFNFPLINLNYDLSNFNEATFVNDLSAWKDADLLNFCKRFILEGYDLRKIPFIITSNQTPLKYFFKKHRDLVSLEAFNRRVETFKFSFKSHHCRKFTPNHVSKVVNSNQHATFVKILHKDTGAFHTGSTLLGFMSTVCKPKERTQTSHVVEMVNSVPDFEPQIKVIVPCKMSELRTKSKIWVLKNLYYEGITSSEIARLFTLFWAQSYEGITLQNITAIVADFAAETKKAILVKTEEATMGCHYIQDDLRLFVCKAMDDDFVFPDIPKHSTYSIYLELVQLYAPKLLMFSAALVGIYLIFKTCKFIVGLFSDPVSAEAKFAKSATLRTKRGGAQATIDKVLTPPPVAYTRSVKTIKKKLSPPQSKLKSEGSLDANGDAVMKKVTKSLVEVHGDSSCKGLMVRDDIGVTVSHILPPTSGDQLWVTIDGQLYDAESLIQDDHRDLMVFRVLKCPKFFPHLVKFMPSRTEVVDPSDVSAIIITRNDNLAYVKPLLLKTYSTKNVDTYGENKARYGLSYVGELAAYHMDIGTEPGDCGSPIIVKNTRVSKKLIAMHCAGSKYKGFGTPLYQEDFINQPYLEKLEAEGLPRAFKCYEDDFNHKIGNNLEIVGKLHHPKTWAPLYIVPSKKTRLWRSPISPEVVKTQPAILDKGDPRCLDKDISIMEQGILKWDVEQKTIPIVEMNQLVEGISSYFVRKIAQKNLTPRILTMQEVINRVTALRSSNPINFKSSPGFPYTHIDNVTTKQAYFRQDPKTGIYRLNDTWECHKLNEDMTQVESFCKRGWYKPTSIYAYNLKDETRPNSKIEQYKTRSIAAAPLMDTLLFRKYFGYALWSISECNAEVAPQIGINPLGMDWSVLYMRLRTVSKIGFDTDFKAWDSTIPLQFMENVWAIYDGIYRVLDPHYEPHHANIRRNLHHSLEEALIGYNKHVIKLPGGQVSGSPLTSMDNCIINMMFYFYVWRKTCPEDMKSYENFDKHVAFAVFGDDNLCTVSDYARSWFTPTAFQTILKEDLGMNSTAADKTPEVKWTKLDDMTFLCREFHNENQITLGPLKKDTIESMLEWVRGTSHLFKSVDEVGDVDPEQIDMAIKSYLDESSLRGNEYYESAFKRVTKLCGGKHPPPMYVSQKDRLVEVTKLPGMNSPDLT